MARAAFLRARHDRNVLRVRVTAMVLYHPVVSNVVGLSFRVTCQRVHSRKVENSRRFTANCLITFGGFTFGRRFTRVIGPLATGQLFLVNVMLANPRT